MIIVEVEKLLIWIGDGKRRRNEKKEDGRRSGKREDWRRDLKKEKYLRENNRWSGGDDWRKNKNRWRSKRYYKKKNKERGLKWCLK